MYMYMDHVIHKYRDTVTHTQLVLSVVGVVIGSVGDVTGAVMDETLLMGGREMGRGAAISESGVWWTMPPRSCCMATSRTVMRLLQSEIPFSASSALFKACLVSNSC